MKNKIILCVGWFGVLTPVYAAGALTVLFALGYTDPLIIGRIVAVSAIHYFVGRKLLKAVVVKKGIKNV